MAVINSFSSVLASFNATQRVVSAAYVSGGSLTCSVASVAAAASDSIGSVYRFGFIPSGARIESIKMQNDATTAGVWTLGAYLNTQQALNLATCVASWNSSTAYVPGNVVYLNGVVYYCFAGNTNDPPPSGNWTTGNATIAAPGTRPVPNAQLIFGAGISTAIQEPIAINVYSPSIGGVGFAAANLNLRVWELLGFSVDPGYDFHLALTATSAPSAAGSIALAWAWVR
jgi:hypothetical protein